MNVLQTQLSIEIRNNTENMNWQLFYNGKLINYTLLQLKILKKLLQLTNFEIENI